MSLLELGSFELAFFEQTMCRNVRGVLGDLSFWRRSFVLRAFRNGGAGGKSRRSKLASHICASLGGREDGGVAPIFFNFAGRPRSAQRYGIVDRSAPSSVDGPSKPAGRLSRIRVGLVDSEEDPGA